MEVGGDAIELCSCRVRQGRILGVNLEHCREMRRVNILTPFSTT